MLSFTEPAVTVADASAYLAASGEAGWDGTEDAKGHAIIRGQRYIAGIGNGRWATEWDNADAPDGVKFAIAEAALRELVAPGSLAPDFTASKVVKREKKKVGPLEKELEYAEAVNASAVRPNIAIIEHLLAGLITAAGSASVPLLRV